jgi:hypothetical protein
VIFDGMVLADGSIAVGDLGGPLRPSAQQLAAPGVGWRPRFAPA